MQVLTVMFTDDEIRTQLEALGYHNIPDYQLRLFKEDLEMLIYQEQNKHGDQPKLTSTDEEASIVEGETEGDTESGDVARPKGKTKHTVSGGVSHGKGKKLHPRFCALSELPFDKQKRSSSPATSDSSHASGAHPLRWHRRKVLRHINGVPVICEEPFTDTTDTDISALSDRMSSVPVDDSESEATTTGSRPGSRPASWGPDCPIINTVMCKDTKGYPCPPVSKLSAQTVKKGKKTVTRGQYYDEIVRYLPKSFVESRGPFQTLKKSAPADRYKMYSDMWNRCRIPGESPDSELRWCIRALLLTKRCPDVEVYALRKKDAVEHAKRLKDNQFRV